MSEKMYLGDLAWRLDAEAVDRPRIAKQLSDGESQQAKIFDKWAVRSRTLKSISVTLHKQIKGGFRPGTTKYLEKAAVLVKQALIDNDASTSYWNVYRECFTEELPAEKPHLQNLMANVEFEKTELDAVQDDHFFLVTLAKHASDYQVYRQDVEWFVECFPIQRPESFTKIIDLVPSFDEVASLKLQLNEIKQTVDEQSLTIKGFVDDLGHLVGKQELAQIIRESSEVAKANLLKIESMVNSLSQVVGDNQREVQSGADRDQHEFSKLREKTDDQARSFEGFMAQFANVYADVERLDHSQRLFTAELQETMRLSIDSFKEEFTDRIAAIDSSLLGFRTSGTAEGEGQRPRQHGYLSPFQERASRVAFDSRPVEDRIEFNDFLVGFITRSRSRQFGLSETALRAVCGLFTGSPLIVTTQMDLIVTWLEELGWLEHALFRDVSPLWVEPAVWESEQQALAGRVDDKRVVVLSGFDEGLIETYLTPVIKSWARSDYVGGGTKLFLVPTNPSAANDLAIPHVNVDLLQVANVQTFSDLPVIASKSRRVSINGLDNWLDDELRLDAKQENLSVNKTVSKVAAVMLENSSTQSSAQLKLYLQLYSSLTRAGFQDESIETLLKDTVVTA